jgi:transcriptional regulator with XRE-family HTH domain
MLYMTAGTLIKDARKKAGLSQAELANRLNTTQSAVARLESPRSNPRLDTLDRAIAATGRELELSFRAAAPQVDETMTASNLRKSSAERLRYFAAAYNDLRRLAPTVRESGGS